MIYKIIKVVDFLTLIGEVLVKILLELMLLGIVVIVSLGIIDMLVKHFG